MSLGASLAGDVAESFRRAREVGAGRDGLNILLYEDPQAALREPLSDARGPLRGVPVVVKDNIATTVMPTSCGSRILEGYIRRPIASRADHLAGRPLRSQRALYGSPSAPRLEARFDNRRRCVVWSA
jgi:hypothetical protein